MPDVLTRSTHHVNAVPFSFPRYPGPNHVAASRVSNRPLHRPTDLIEPPAASDSLSELGTLCKATAALGWEPHDRLRGWFVRAYDIVKLSSVLVGRVVGFLRQGPEFSRNRTNSGFRLTLRFG